MQLPYAPLNVVKEAFILFLGGLTIAAHELVNATSGVNELVLTSVEWVRSARDFNFYHGVSFAFKFYRVISLAGRTSKEHIAVGHILKYDGTIVLGMNTFFHFFYLLYKL